MLCEIKEELIKLSEEKNPYVDMPKDVLEKHLGQMKEARDTNKSFQEVDLLQSFGQILSTEDEQKIKQHTELTSEVANLKKTGDLGKISETENELATLNLNDSIDRIKEMDKNFPIESVINNTNMNSLEKARALRPLEAAAKYTVKALATLRKEIPDANSGTVLQSFASPDGKKIDPVAMVKEIGTSIGVLKKE